MSDIQTFGAWIGAISAIAFAAVGVFKVGMAVVTRERRLAHAARDEMHSTMAGIRLEIQERLPREVYRAEQDALLARVARLERKTGLNGTA